MASPVPARPALPMLANGVTFLSEEAHFSPVHPARLGGSHSKCPRPAAPNLFGPRDRFRGRRLLHGRAGDSSGGNGSGGSGGHAGDGGAPTELRLPARHSRAEQAADTQHCLSGKKSAATPRSE